MEAYVTHYSIPEGADWQPWPWGKEVKPTNPELLTWPGKKAFALLRCKGHPTGAVILMPVHAIQLSNGRKWDSYNGFRDNLGPA